MIEMKEVVRYLDNSGSKEYGYYDRLGRFIRHRTNGLPALIHLDGNPMLLWSYHGVTSSFSGQPSSITKSSFPPHWLMQYRNENNNFHNDIGPISVRIKGNPLIDWYLKDDITIPIPKFELEIVAAYYFVRNSNITDEVNDWLESNNYPKDFQKWNDDIRLLFKLTFG